MILLFFAIVVATSTRDPDNLILLPLETGAACLDGSPYGLYLLNNSIDSTRWTISMDGGGWCYDENDCFGRSKTIKGSSTMLPKQGNCFDDAGYDPGLGTGTSNCVHLPYCDGASFSGFRKEPWPQANWGRTPNPGTPKNATLFFRGARNLQASLELMASRYNLQNATEVVVTGSSAGGLATLLHLDRIAQMIHKVAPKATVRGVSDAGYFLDHEDFSHDSDGFPDRMQYIYTMQHMQGQLDANCTVKYTGEEYKCFMAPHTEATTRTPYFMLNSKYDALQLSGIVLRLPCLNRNPSMCNATEAAAMVSYAEAFVTSFDSTFKLQNGAFITSCACHACPWDFLSLRNTTPHQALEQWYQSSINASGKPGSGSGSAAYSYSHDGSSNRNVYVDGNFVNGNGSLLKTPSCANYTFKR